MPALLFYHDMKTRNTQEKWLGVQRAAFTNQNENIFNNLEEHSVLGYLLDFLCLLHAAHSSVIVVYPSYLEGPSVENFVTFNAGTQLTCSRDPSPRSPKHWAAGLPACMHTGISKGAEDPNSCFSTCQCSRLLTY